MKEYLYKGIKIFGLSNFYNNVREILQIWKVRLRGKQKVFVIGFNKTGTTTIEKVLRDFGYIMGHQMKASGLFDEYSKRDYSGLFKLCESAEAFQDIPFSHPDIYKVLDERFPNSKFILTVRNDEEQWFNSMVKFHSKVIGHGHVPKREDFLNDPTVYKGWRWKVHTSIFGENLYDKEHYTQIYLKHNEDVQKYFAHRSEDLLIVNVANKKDYIRLCSFIGKSPQGEDFPWENKTESH